jgi:hypothetical protein
VLLGATEAPTEDDLDLEALRVPALPVPSVLDDRPGFAWATNPASAPTSATAPTPTHLVSVEARRSPSSRVTSGRGPGIRVRSMR